MISSSDRLFSDGMKLGQLLFVKKWNVKIFINMKTILFSYSVAWDISCRKMFAVSLIVIVIAAASIATNNQTNYVVYPIQKYGHHQEYYCDPTNNRVGYRRYRFESDSSFTNSLDANSNCFSKTIVLCGIGADVHAFILDDLLVMPITGANVEFVEKVQMSQYEPFDKSHSVVIENHSSLQQEGSTGEFAIEEAVTHELTIATSMQMTDSTSVSIPLVADASMKLSVGREVATSYSTATKKHIHFRRKKS